MRELDNRGVRDVLIEGCDGLSSFPEAFEASWRHAVEETGTVHQIQASLRFGPKLTARPSQPRCG